MIVNDSKTELLFASRNKDLTLNIKCGTQIVNSKTTLKALGVQISEDLNWEKHVDYAINKSRQAVRRIKYIKKWLTISDALKLVSSQYHSITFLRGSHLDDSLVFSIMEKTK